ncbi:RAD5A, partial [Symbiodinium necroappetens]
MQQRECETELFDLTLHRVRVDPLALEEPLAVSSIQAKSSTQLGWQLELRQRQSVILRGGILGDAPGYGKTATMIGLIDASAGTRHCQLHLPAESDPYFFKSRATLVLAPSNLLKQWADEIQKFTANPEGSTKLEVLSIGTAAQLKMLTVDKVSRADIVICSYRLLYSPVYRRRLQELSGDFSQVSNGEAARMAVDIQSLRRNTKRFRENPSELGWLQIPDSSTGSPQRASVAAASSDDANNLCFPVLEQVWWRRIVFDEFHELEAIGDTAQFDSLQCICAGCRWGLTGTPPTRDLSQVATLAKLFQLPGLPCEDGSEYELQLAQEMARSFLDRFARQNTSEEIETVPLNEHLVAVEQTPEERAIYLQASHDLCQASGAALEITGESRGVERLIKLCSHFAAYSGMASGSSADAGTECRRILSSKEQQAKRAANQMQRWGIRLELRLRETSAVSCGQRFELQTGILRRLGATVPEAPMSCTDGQGHELSDAPVSAQDYTSTWAAVSQPAAAASAAACLVEVARMCLSELQRKAGEFEETEDGLQDRMVAAAEAASSSQRSLQFFQRTLAAARGEASSEQRSCSICLEEDLNEEDLSIATCAHVFHTTCLQEVVKKFGNCPERRHKLGKSDVTRLTKELQAPGPGRGCKLRGSSKAFEKQAGSKLAALAVHLKKLHERGEKALVFCQWEDLKRCVSAALNGLGVPHLELVGSVFQRAEVLRRFQDEDGDGADGGSRSLLLSLEHAASGTNLTAANHVVFVHPMYATSAERAVAYEAQAIARCRRYGQQKPEVNCWRFVTCGTIEESITASHQKELWRREAGSNAKHDSLAWNHWRAFPVPEPYRKLLAAAESFQGARPGYVFKVDKHGLGYYLDPVQVNRSIWDDVVSKLPETWRDTPHREEQLRVSQQQSCGLSMSHSDFGFVVDKVEDEPGQKLHKGEAIVAIEGRLLAGLSAPQMQASFQKRRVDGARLYVVDLAKAEELSRRDPNIIEMWDPVKQHNYFFHKKTGKSAWTLEELQPAPSTSTSTSASSEKRKADASQAPIDIAHFMQHGFAKQKEQPKKKAKAKADETDRS